MSIKLKVIFFSLSPAIRRENWVWYSFITFFAEGGIYFIIFWHSFITFFAEADILPLESLILIDL